MLSLNDPRWADLLHAYGSAADIPALLNQLQPSSRSADDAEPWFSLWSALAHQGDVYTASFAAVPHIVQVLEKDPINADPSFFLLPASIEIGRQVHKHPIPSFLDEAYYAAIKKLPQLLFATFDRPWDEDFTRVALSVIAAVKGQTSLAEVVLELEPDVLKEFQEWWWGDPR